MSILADHGYTVPNRPTEKLTEELVAVLEKHFSVPGINKEKNNDAEVKETSGKSDFYKKIKSTLIQRHNDPEVSKNSRKKIDGKSNSWTRFKAKWKNKTSSQITRRKEALKILLPLICNWQKRFIEKLKLIPALERRKTVCPKCEKKIDVLHFHNHLVTEHTKIESSEWRKQNPAFLHNFSKSEMREIYNLLEGCTLGQVAECLKVPFEVFRKMSFDGEDVKKEEPLSFELFLEAEAPIFVCFFISNLRLTDKSEMELLDIIDRDFSVLRKIKSKKTSKKHHKKKIKGGVKKKKKKKEYKSTLPKHFKGNDYKSEPLEIFKYGFRIVRKR